MTQMRSNAEILAQRLDQALPAHKAFVPPLSPDPLVNVAAEIARMKLPILSQQSSVRIETQVLREYDRHYRTPRPVIRFTVSAARWGMIASFVLVLLIFGLMPAVAFSVPGDSLYPLKQIYESVELASATTPAAKASIYLQHADRRSQEALVLLDRGQFDPTLITAALTDIEAAQALDTGIEASARLRGQRLQVKAVLAFVIDDAAETGLGAPADLVPLAQQVEELPEAPALSIPPTAAATATATPTTTPTPTPTPSPTATHSGSETPSATLEPTLRPSRTPRVQATRIPTCVSNGLACQSQGVPGGIVIPPTRRPTHEPPNDNAAGNASGGQGNGSENNNGNSNANNGGGNGNGGKSDK